MATKTAARRGKVAVKSSGKAAGGKTVARRRPAARTVGAQRSTGTAAPRRGAGVGLPSAATALPGPARALQGMLEREVGRLSDAMREAEASLRRAERQIQAEAARRVKALRKEVRARLAVLAATRRRAELTVRRLSDAAEGSWREIDRSGRAIAGEARSAVTSVAELFRKALVR